MVVLDSVILVERADLVEQEQEQEQVEAPLTLSMEVMHSRCLKNL